MAAASTSYAHRYDELFYRYQREGAARSANQLLPRVLRHLDVRSVLDVGCGAGAWVKVYEDLGVPICVGIDGDYVDRSVLLMKPENFQPADITQPFDLGRQFELVQCLEVAEHVPSHFSDVLIDNLCRHGRMVLFSAAPPGQGGEDHINERPYVHWRSAFARHGFDLYDFVRPEVRGDALIEPWYRFNVLFFAHRSITASLPAAVTRFAVPDNGAIADVSPWTYQARKLLLRCLWPSLVSRMAVWKHRRIVDRMAKGSP